MSGIHVFVGPSLDLTEAKAILGDAHYHPPVKMGDVAALMAARPRLVCIIDGFFERVPAVWHKEIMFALSRGVRVVGAASMGALRGAELHDLGMEGIGSIFEAFRSGEITADDEVAVAHGSAEEGYRPSSEAMVNIRFGLARAEKLGVVSEAMRDTLIERSRARFYADRSWFSVLADAADEGGDAARESLRAFLRDDQPNQKRDDAILALRHCAETRDRAGSSDCPFEPTEFWNRLLQTTRQDSGTHDRRVLDRARVVLDDLRQLSSEAMLSVLLEYEAGRSSLRISQERASAAGRDLRVRSGLLSAADTRAWLANSHLNDTDFTRICRLEAIRAELLQRHAAQVDEALLLELKRSGHFAAIAREVVDPDEPLDADAAPTLGDTNVDTPTLLAWYERTFRPIRGGVDQHAKERGFHNGPSFLRELLRAYLADERRERRAGSDGARGASTRRHSASGTNEP